MKLRVKLTIIIASMTAVMISVISFILLRQANFLQTKSAVENTNNMANAESVKMQMKFEAYLHTIETVAEIFGAFKDVEMSRRRQDFDRIMYNVVRANPLFDRNVFGMEARRYRQRPPCVQHPSYTRTKHRREGDHYHRRFFRMEQGRIRPLPAGDSQQRGVALYAPYPHTFC